MPMSVQVFFSLADRSAGLRHSSNFLRTLYRIKVMVGIILSHDYRGKYLKNNSIVFDSMASNYANA